MIDLTRAELEARLAALGDELASKRAELERIDAVLPRLRADLERAGPAEDAFNAQHRRLADERTALMARYGCRVIDNGPGHVGVYAGRIPVPREVEKRIVELFRAIRQLESDRQDWLRSGGFSVANATQRHEECRIARALLAASVAELEQGR